MNATTDEVDVPLRLPRVLVPVCGLAIAVSGAIALWPLPPPRSLLAPTQSADEEVVPFRLASLDLDAFRVPIWVAPPPPPAPPTPEPPPPPLRLTLLAIVREGNNYKAALYDPDTDRLLVVASGESVSGRTVESVQSDRVSLRDSKGTRTLVLQQGKDKEP